MNSTAVRRARQAARRRTLELLALRRAEAAGRRPPERRAEYQVRPGRAEAGPDG
ncbi:hypothetical protein [Jiangella aurantiaca]|uniref:hypothetical protein n=1 Tax=Jiangella aurantiaca TaxID=2530373 RepID=UPI0013A5C03D|nr:hypothetical protein [Jiangella aurantiaca]